MGISFLPHLLFTSLLFTAICKASSDSHFAFLHFFFLGMVLLPVSYTVPWASVHSSSGTLSIRSNPLNLFLTSTETLENTTETATSQLPWFYYSQPVPGVSPGGLWTHPLEIAMEAVSRRASNLNGTGENVLIHICTKHHHRAGTQARLEHCQARVGLPMRQMGYANCPSQTADKWGGGIWT